MVLSLRIQKTLKEGVRKVVTIFHLKKKVCVIYEQHNSILNPEQKRTLSDFSEQTKAGLTSIGLSMPDMLKGNKKNALDSEEQHFFDFATENT